MSRTRYRLGQFFRYLRPQPLSPAQREEVEQVLGPRLSELFARQSAGEQAHSLRVMHAVAGNSQTACAELLQAALLHDVGKSVAPLSLLDRALVVLGRRAAPAVARRWGAGPASGLQRPFVTARHHADWGGDLCAQAGAPPLTVALIRRHQTPVTAPATAEDRLLAQLQAADDDH